MFSWQGFGSDMTEDFHSYTDGVVLTVAIRLNTIKYDNDLFFTIALRFSVLSIETKARSAISFIYVDSLDTASHH